MTDRYMCPPTHSHGASNTCRANHGCRCDECVAQGTEYAYWRRGRLSAGKPLLVDALGTIRRIRALRRLGWSRRAIGERMGVTPEGVSSVLRRKKVTAATEAKVRAVYDELSMRVPVARTRTEAANIAFTKRRAEEAGWGGPLSWDEGELDKRTARAKGVAA